MKIDVKIHIPDTYLEVLPSLKGNQDFTVTVDTDYIEDELDLSRAISAEVYEKSGYLIGDDAREFVPEFTALMSDVFANSVEDFTNEGTYRNMIVKIRKIINDRNLYCNEMVSKIRKVVNS